MPTPFVRDVLLPAHPDRQPVLDASACSVPLEIRRSPIHGWGLFAAAPIPAGHRIIEYTGQLIDDAEAERRRPRPLMFLLRLGPNRLIDGGIGGSGAECSNHACQPNMVARRDGERAILFSARPIAAGEELVWDYGMMGGTPFRCECRAPDCRARATGGAGAGRASAPR